MNMQTCQNCRQANPSGQPFCSNCGLPLNPQPNSFGQPNFQNQPAINQPPPFNQPNFNQQPPNFNQPPSNFGAPPPPANKKSPIKIIVAIFMVFGALAAVCGGIAKFSTGIKKNRRADHFRPRAGQIVGSNQDTGQMAGTGRHRHDFRQQRQI
jgi:hypothetical protein